MNSTIVKSPSYRYWEIIFILLVGMLVLAITAGAEYKITGGRLGVPLDDAWIHFQFARNFYHHFEIAFNTHQPTPGTTSFLWVILLALFGAPFNKYILAAKLLSAFFYLSCGVLVYLLGLIFLRSRGAAVLGAVLTLIAGRFAWSGFSGMEITLFAACTLLCILLFARKEEGENISPLILGLISGLGTMARPEGHLFFFCLLPFISRNSWKNMIPFSVGYLVFALPYSLFCYTQIGHFFPNTFFSKTSGFLSQFDFWFLLGYGYIVFKDMPLLSLFMPLGLGFIFRSLFSQPRNINNQAESVTALWGVGLVMAYAVIFPRYFHYCRYLIPLLPFHILWGLKGVLIFRDFIYRLWRKISLISPTIGEYWGTTPSPLIRKRLNRWGKVFLITSCIPLTVMRIDQFAWNVSNINDQQVDMANWIKKNTPPEALIAADDVGAIGFIAKRRVLDIFGVITPEINEKYRGLIPREKGFVEEVTKLLRLKKPDYLVIHPLFYGNLIREKFRCKEIYSNELRINSICSQNRFISYKVDWDIKVSRN
jgi:hypothetical protein